MEKKNKHDNHHHGSGFVWGLIIGALLATLLTNKKGRAILKELIDMGLEMIEDFLDEKKKEIKVNHSFKKVEIEPVEEVHEVVREVKKPKPEPARAAKEEEDVLEEVREDIESEITEDESSREEIVEKEVEEEVVELAPPEPKPIKNDTGGLKKRLFRGIRKKK